MPSKALHKVQKHVAKKKGKNAALHQNSRDSQRLRRAAERQDKQLKAASLRDNSRLPYLRRVAFFQQLVLGRNAPFANEDVHQAICSYLQRHDAELDQLRVDRRPGRPASTHHDTLVQLQSRESAEYLSGFWLPDLQDATNLNTLRTWSAEWTAMNQLSFCRVARDGSFHPSSFPPKGLS